jgi:hypothetical protein
MIERTGADLDAVAGGGLEECRCSPGSPGYTVVGNIPPYNAVMREVRCEKVIKL